jgi:hypothetical protein
LLVLAACREKGYDTMGRSFSLGMMDGSAISDSAEREFKESPEWKQYDRERLAVADLQADSAKRFPQKGRSADAADTPSPRTRRFLEPRPELLVNPDVSLSRLRAAEALGIAPRTLDRWVRGEKLAPFGAGLRKRFKVKDLQRILDLKSLDKRDKK